LRDHPEAFYLARKSASGQTFKGKAHRLSSADGNNVKLAHTGFNLHFA
jgi:hypothetical protein